CPLLVSRRVCKRHGLQVSHKHGIVDPDVLAESCCAFRLVDGDADEYQAAVPEFVLELDEFGYFRAAWLAPARPEIDHHDLALPLRDGLILSLEVGQGGGD